MYLYIIFTISKLLSWHFKIHFDDDEHMLIFILFGLLTYCLKEMMSIGGQTGCLRLQGDLLCYVPPSSCLSAIPHH